MFTNAKTFPISVIDTNNIKHKLFFHSDGLEKIEHNFAFSEFECYSYFVFVALNICNSQEF